MGTLFHRGKKWGINFLDPDGRQVRRVVSEFREVAQAALKKTEMDILLGQYSDEKKLKAALFEEFVDEFVRNYVNLENRRPESQPGRIKVVKERFKGQSLNEIDTRTIRQFLSDIRAQFKPATFNRYLSLLRCMFNRAKEWKLLEGDNPTDGIKKLSEENERCRSLTDQEQQALLTHCHGVTHAIVVTALQTGLRWNEIINLKWSQTEKSNYVDFDNNVIVIHSALSKSKKSRFIPMSYALQCELFDLRKTATSEYVFTSRLTGRPFNNIRKSFQTAVRKAGIKDLRFHDLRHVFASNLVRKDVDLYVVQRC